MPNVYYQAKALWETDQREEAFNLFNSYLEEKLGQPVFEQPKSILQSTLSNTFDIDLTRMLQSTYALILQVPFSRVFRIIWDLDQAQEWIWFLLGYNFKAQDKQLLEEIYEYVGGDKALYLNTDEDFLNLAHDLSQSALKGILSPNPLDQPNGGRITLLLEKIDEVNDADWGSLKPLLKNSLEKAYIQCPSDFWERLVEQEPEEVVLRFLHDTFSRYDQSIESAQMRWFVSVADHKQFADAVIASLEVMLGKGHSQQWLTEVVQLDAGFSSVTNGATWLNSLLQALKQGDFDLLGNK